MCLLFVITRSHNIPVTGFGVQGALDEETSATKHFLELRSKKPNSLLKDSKHTCNNETLFKCVNGICILKKWVCDSHDDCGDYSDEYYCGSSSKNACPSNRFDCGSGQCYDLIFVCDGEADCSNGADEAEGICTDGRGERPVQCTPSQFKCANGHQCIHHSLVCNNESNCSDASDEAHCIHCSNVTQFACKSPFTHRTDKCIPRGYICDGKEDCEHGQDEKLPICMADAPYSGHQSTGDSSSTSIRSHHGHHWLSTGKIKKQSTHLTFRCFSNQFQCRDGVNCISINSRCDGRVDCNDASDEDDCNFYKPFFQRSAPSPLTYTYSSLLPYSSSSPPPPPPPLPTVSGVRVTVYDAPQTQYSGDDVVFRCRDEGDTRLPVRWSRLDGKPFPPNTTQVNGRLSMYNVRFNDSGVYICESVGARDYERRERAQLYIIERPTSSKGAWYRSSTSTTPVPSPASLIGLPVAHVCQVNQRPCKGSEGCFDLNNMCDAYKDCTDGSDEVNCVARCDYDQFRCANSFQCIMKREHCDGIAQCTDASDEFSCDCKLTFSPH